MSIVHVRSTLAVSVLVHVAAGFGLLVLSFWKISKLTPKPQEIVFSSALALPTVAQANPGPAREPGRAAAGKRVARKIAAAVTTPAPAATGTEEPGDTEAVPHGGGTSVGLDLVGTPPGEIVADAPPPPPPPMVDQVSIEAQRTAGTRELHLPDGVVAQLRGQGISQLRVSAHVCIDEAGQVASLRFGGSEGHELAEPTLRAGIAGWRYRPWQVNGQPVRACSVVVFNYRITP
jgi:hypothetical protein